MPSPLMRMSLGEGACMAPKNIVLAAGLLPGLAGVGAGAAGADAGAPLIVGLPHAPQKRWPGAIASPQYAHTFGAPLPNGSAAALGPVSAPLFLPTPSEAPHSWHTVALLGDSASHASHTSPSVMDKPSWCESYLIANARQRTACRTKPDGSWRRGANARAPLSGHSSVCGTAARTAARRSSQSP